MTLPRGAAGGTPGWAGGDCGVVEQARLEGQPACTASASAHRSSACASRNAHWDRADACRSHRPGGGGGRGQQGSIELLAKLDKLFVTQVEGVLLISGISIIATFLESEVTGMVAD